MRRTQAIPIAFLLVAAAGSPAFAGPGPGAGGGTDPPPPQTGPITVEYDNGDSRVTTTSITSGSAFRSQGGGDRSPCRFDFLPDNDGDGLLDPDVEPMPIDSDRWVFRETTTAFDPLDDVFDAGDWAELAELGGLTLSETMATYGPVDSAVRRFNVFCNGTHGSGLNVSQSRGSILVTLTDPFWGYASRRDRLVALLPWPTVIASSQPDVSVFGGLPVNMPAVFQMNAESWGGFLSPPSSYRGWTTQIVANATSMQFALSFTPDGGEPRTMSVPCVGADAELPDTGWVPARPADVPDFATPGQFEAPCVWIPPEPGEVTVTAEVVYSVDSVVTGPSGERFREPLAGELRSALPLTLRVDELRIVNVSPPALDDVVGSAP